MIEKRTVDIRFESKNRVIITTPFKQKIFNVSNEDHLKYIDLITLEKYDIKKKRMPFFLKFHTDQRLDAEISNQICYPYLSVWYEKENGQHKFVDYVDIDNIKKLSVSVQSNDD